MTVRVRLLGVPRISAAEGQPHPQPQWRKSWAVLARVALAERPVSRLALARDIFSAADDPAAALRWSLADLRRAIGIPGLLRGDPLSIGESELVLDVRELAAGTLAGSEIGGVLLDGVEVRESATFELWLLTTRSSTTARSREVLRERALQLMGRGATAEADELAERSVALDPLDTDAQELFLRCLVADGRTGTARAQLAACEGMFAAEGLPVSPALRAAAEDHRAGAPGGLRAAVRAGALLQAATAAIAAGAVDGGIETLRRAADDASAANDQRLQAEVLSALGTALVHGVRGFDGEAAVVLHRALRTARAAGLPSVAAAALRELAFVDIQAGRHASAARLLSDAGAEDADPALAADILSLQGMNLADRGRHREAIDALQRSAELAGSARPRQRVWSLGVLARSLLLAGRLDEALAAAEASVDGARSQRWNGFLPWPQAIRAECRCLMGDPATALDDAEQAFALSCELGDPCWEGMAGRALSRISAATGDVDAAWRWIAEARRRSNRFSDSYVWVFGYVGLAELELAAATDPARVPALAERLHRDSVRNDLPEFAAWALLHRARAGAPDCLALARGTGVDVDNPVLVAELARG